jgi:hypothetical protein
VQNTPSHVVTTRTKLDKVASDQVLSVFTSLADQFANSAPNAYLVRLARKKVSVSIVNPATFLVAVGNPSVATGSVWSQSGAGSSSVSAFIAIVRTVPPCNLYQADRGQLWGQM